MKRSANTSEELGLQLSLEDLGQPLIDTTFCILDVETTGTNSRHDLICEIGAVKVKGGETVGTFQTLVNPGVALPPEITVITGLTDAVLAPAPRIEQVITSLRQFIGDAVFVAHNASFDLGFVKAAFERAGIDDCFETRYAISNSELSPNALGSKIDQVTELSMMPLRLAIFCTSSSNERLDGVSQGSMTLLLSANSRATRKQRNFDSPSHFLAHPGCTS